MADPPEDLSGDPAPRRPRDLAVLLLALSGEPPRARARDQQADRAGEALRREVLDRLAALDPDPEALEAALGEIVAALGAPTGPTRAVGSQVLQEWRDSQASAGYWPWLLAEAVAEGERTRDPSRRRRRGAP